MKQEGIIADPNNQIKIVLWEDQVDSITKGKTYLFKNIRVKENNNKERYVNPTKSVAEAEYTIQEVQPFEEKIVVEKVPETTLVETGNIIGTSDLTKFKSCLVCGNKVIPKNTKIGNCQKCKMTVKIQSCNDEWQLKRVLLTNNDLTRRLSVYNAQMSQLLSMCGLERDCTEDDVTEGLLSLDAVTVEYDCVPYRVQNIALC